MVEITQKSFYIAIVPIAVFLDFLWGDPSWCPHPVQLMGWLIRELREKAEKIAGGDVIKLRIGGFFITTTLIFISGFSGWLIEYIAMNGSGFLGLISKLLLLIGLASGLAAKSLYEAINEVINNLPSLLGVKTLEASRKRLKRIVGRDVDELNEDEILRAAAETASENAVDGIFAPLFWMFIGIVSWNISSILPGPLALVWIFKASSTIDSMIGYKRGSLRWLGSAGAHLDDFLTWIPCRIVFLTLPIISKNSRNILSIIKEAYKDGIKDISPNSGLSEAIFAYCADVKMGGLNSYENHQTPKPILAGDKPKADIYSIYRIIKLGIKLELFWVSIYIFLCIICIR